MTHSINEAELSKAIDQMLYKYAEDVADKRGLKGISEAKNVILALITQDRATQRHELEQAVMGLVGENLPEYSDEDWKGHKVTMPIYANIERNGFLSELRANLALLFERNGDE